MPQKWLILSNACGLTVPSANDSVAQPSRFIREAQSEKLRVVRRVERVVRLRVRMRVFNRPRLIVVYGKLARKFVETAAAFRHARKLKTLFFNSRKQHADCRRSIDGPLMRAPSRTGF